MSQAESSGDGARAGESFVNEATVRRRLRSEGLTLVKRKGLYTVERAGFAPKGYPANATMAEVQTWIEWRFQPGAF